MESFSVYFSMGYGHILQPFAWDHILFVVTLCLMYLPNKFKSIIGLVTAFTIGHSLTLFLVALKYFKAPIEIIEFLIPITIALSAGITIYKQLTKKTEQSNITFQFILTVIFGMIHGIAFATETFGLEGRVDLAMKVLGFNVGIEVAQIIVVLLFSLFALVVIKLIKNSKQIFILANAMVIFAYAIYLAIVNAQHL